MAQVGNNYMNMSGYGYGPGYQAPLALTQPEAIPSWMPTQSAPIPRAFPMASAAAPAFNYETDMGGLMPTSTPLGGTPTNSQIFSDIGGQAPGGMFSGIGQWMKDSGFLGTRDQQGWGGLALGGASSLANMYMGMKQYGLAKDQLAFQKESFNKQYDANRTLTNSRLEDRQRARVASNAGAYQSVGDYMNEKGVK